MNKPELAKIISSGAKISKADVEQVFRSLAGAVASAIREGEEVTIPGICRVKTKTRAARLARNSRTGEQVEVPEKTVVTIKAVKGLY